MRPSILIVDDDDTVAKLLAFAFRREGWDPTTIRDGRSAVEHVAISSPADAVVLDVMLPCRDGYAVASAMRSDPRWTGVPIVMLSGRIVEDEEDRARTLDVDAFFQKPFRALSLVAAVKKLSARAAAV
jgi:chemosensory pili system protein ChpA (sensor histidine kinase/response regulator)